MNVGVARKASRQESVQVPGQSSPGLAPTGCLIADIAWHPILLTSGFARSWHLATMLPRLEFPIQAESNIIYISNRCTDTWHLCVVVPCAAHFGTVAFPQKTCSFPSFLLTAASTWESIVSTNRNIGCLWDVLSFNIIPLKYAIVASSNLFNNKKGGF